MCKYTCVCARATHKCVCTGEGQRINLGIAFKKQSIFLKDRVSH